jgi:hypothetical protein
VRSFPNDPEGEENVSCDFAAVGVGSILAALIGAFAVDTSPPRTAVIEESGGRSNSPASSPSPLSPQSRSGRRRVRLHLTLDLPGWHELRWYA